MIALLLAGSSFALYTRQLEHLTPSWFLSLLHVCHKDKDYRGKYKMQFLDDGVISQGGKSYDKRPAPVWKSNCEMVKATACTLKCSEPASLTCFVDEESSGTLALIIIPSLLALSTVLVVALIFYTLCKNKERRHRTSPHFKNGRSCNNYMSIH